MKIYLAGKVGGNKHKIAKLIHGADFKCTDGGNHSEHAFGYGSNDLGECRKGGDLNEIVAGCFRQLIDSCSMLFAYIDCSTAFGTIAEVGYWSGLGGRSFVVINVGAIKEEYVDYGADGSAFDTYWFMCCLPGVRLYLVQSEEQARLTFQGIVDGADR